MSLALTDDPAGLHANPTVTHARSHTDHIYVRVNSVCILQVCDSVPCRNAAVLDKEMLSHFAVDLDHVLQVHNIYRISIYMYYENILSH